MIKSVSIRLKRLVQKTIRTPPKSIQDFDSILRTCSLSSRGICSHESRTGYINRLSVPPFSYPSPSYVGRFITEQFQGERRFSIIGSAPEWQLNTYQLDYAGIWGSDGLVYDVRSSSAIAETVFCWWSGQNEHIAFRSPRKPKRKHLNGRALSLLTHGDTCFYHWMLEGLARLALVPDYYDFDYYLVAGPEKPWMRSWIEAFDLPYDRTIFCNGLTHLAFDQVVFTDRPFREQWPNLHIINFLREIISSTDQTSNARAVLHVSRSDADTRGGSWEKRVAAVPGVDSVELSAYPAREQASLFRGSRIVIGAHGSGLSNILFCSPGSTIIEVFGGHYAPPLYSRISSLLGIKHMCVREEHAEQVLLDQIIGIS